MDDEAKYDPDRMRFEDLDPNHLEALTAWLDHPNTRALHDDLGRQMRGLPAGDQVVHLTRSLQDAEKRRFDILMTLDDSASLEVFDRVVLLLRATNEGIEAAYRRIVELRQ